MEPLIMLEVTAEGMEETLENLDSLELVQWKVRWGDAGGEVGWRWRVLRCTWL